jgi:threonine synthase
VLPLTERTPLLTLGEGDTPLVRSATLEGLCGLDELWFKLEMCNPTGSFKDRGMVVAVAKALEGGARAIMCASTGNTSASAAAYAAKCGIASYVLVPGGRVATGKLAQAIAFGARIIEVDGNFDEALRVARELTAKHPVALVNSVNPNRVEGQKTAAYEICEALGDAPAMLAIPVGNAGNITAYWKGFGECAERGLATLHPRMYGFQAAGAAPIVGGAPVENPQTVATRPAGRRPSWHATRAAG